MNINKYFINLISHKSIKINVFICKFKFNTYIISLYNTYVMWLRPLKIFKLWKYF